MSKFFRDIRLMSTRSITRTLRNPAWVIIGMFQPVLYLLMFAPLLDKLRLPIFGQDNTLNGFVPGLLVMIAIFGAGFAGFAILDDLKDGVVERLRVTPASRLALLLGMVLPEVLVFLAQCTVLLVAASLMGFRANLAGIVALYALMGLIGLMIIAFSFGLTLLIRDQSGLAAILSTISQPLLLLSGVLLPLTLAPQFMRTLAQLNPFSHTVEAARALIKGDFGANEIMLAFAIIAVMTVVSVLWSVRIFRKATA